MKNNNITIGTRRFDKYKTEWAKKTGVFKSPSGKWIVRLRVGKHKTFTTISQHDSEEEALLKYSELTNNE